MLYRNYDARHWGLFAGTVLMLGSGPAMAQQIGEAGTGDGSVLVIGTRETPALDTPNATASRLGLTPLETPASIATIDGDTIRARGDQSIVEAQSRAPGIASVANPGNGGTALSARGFSGQGSVLQLIDGVRLFPAAGTITFPTDPWMVERIDVLSGPASVLYGQGALGGAVNVVMRKPTARTQGQAEIGYGAQDSFRAAAGIGGPDGARAWLRGGAVTGASMGRPDLLPPAMVEALAASGDMRVRHVARRGDREWLAGLGVAAVPLADAHGGLTGVLLFHDLPIDRFNAHRIAELAEIGHWLGPLIHDQGQTPLRVLRNAGRIA